MSKKTEAVEITASDVGSVSAILGAAPAEHVRQPLYRHAACGTASPAGEYTKDSLFLPCAKCGSIPSASDFTWE